MPISVKPKDIRDAMNYDTDVNFTKMFAAQEYLNNPDPKLTFVRETYDRRQGTATLTPTGWTTGTMLITAIPLARGDVVTNISYRSVGATGATIANWWFALYSPAGALLAQTADQTTTAWGATTTKTLALATAQTISVTGTHFLGIMMKSSGTMPTLLGFAGTLLGNSGLVTTSQVNLAGVSSTAYTTTAPATIPTLTPVIDLPYAVTS